jgi:integrase
MHHWLDNIAPIKVTGGKGCRPRTLVGYRSYIRTWVDTSKVAKVRLDKLTPEHLEQLYKPLRDAKRSESTVAQLHRIISRALTVAMRRGRVGFNPAQRMDAPQPAEYEPDILTPDDARKLRVAAEKAPDGARWLVALALGLRQGEALALAWDKIDLDAGVLHVHRELYSLPWKHGCPEAEAKPKEERPCGRRADHCKQRHSGGRFVGTPKSRSASAPRRARAGAASRQPAAKSLSWSFASARAMPTRRPRTGKHGRRFSRPPVSLRSASTTPGTPPLRCYF